ncbi:MAG: hypothetical protein WB679_12785 [Terracidiphilus sp.]
MDKLILQVGKLPRISSFEIIYGNAAVLAKKNALAALVEGTDQRDVVPYLEFFLSGNRFWGKKVPCLLTLKNEEAKLCAAVLLYEYRPWRVPTRIFTSADFYGVRSVLAPADMRATVAQAAADFLIRRGACVALITVKTGNFSAESGGRGLTCATQTRTLPRLLPLRATFDETVSTMGAHTRRNLRAAYRRVRTKLGGSFVIDPELSEREFLAINRVCMYPVASAVAKWRFRCAHELPGRLFAGLRTEDGRWLSLAGGRHLDGITSIDWQMNISDLPTWSIGTAMRAYLIEHEVNRGTSFLTFEGGTPHSMHQAFLQEEVSNLLLAKPYLSPAILRAILPKMMPKVSLLVQMITSDNVIWHSKSLRPKPMFCPQKGIQS